MRLGKTRRHLERYIEIGRILTKHGWDQLLSRLGLAGVFHLRASSGGAPPAPVQVREALEELGPTFIKLGQVLSTRPDLIPTEYADALESLQDNAPQFPVKQAHEVIEAELGQPVSALFLRFDDQPLAAASIGQTHAATLPDGTEAVVKVQRPDIQQTIENDLEIIAGLARFLHRHFASLRVYGLPELADEFAITIRQELDYTKEGRNGDRLKENLADLEYVRIASTIWEFTTSRVLTSERLHGVKITDIHALTEMGADRHAVADNLWKGFLSMIFVNGVFHADPHPGNIIVMPGNVIGLLDYGMVGRLDRELKAFLTMLLAEYVQQDSSGFAEILLSMGTKPSDLNRKEFTTEIDRLLRQYYGAQLGQMHMGELLRSAIRISAKHQVQLPASLGLLIKVILGVEGIDRELDPAYDLTSEARLFIRRSVRDEFSTSTLRDQVIHSLMYWKWLFLELPHRVNDVLRSLAEGSLRVVFHHEGLEPATRNLDRSINRLSFALISTGTIVASALVFSSKVGPMWHGYPMIGLVGFVVSFVFAMFLMLSIIRAGRMW